MIWTIQITNTICFLRIISCERWWLCSCAFHWVLGVLDCLCDVITNDSHVLDVGSGSGYLSLCFTELIGPSAGGGKVVGVEHIPELVEQSVINVRKHHAEAINSGRLCFVAADGRMGWPGEAPYQECFLSFIKILHYDRKNLKVINFQNRQIFNYTNTNCICDINWSISINIEI